MDEKIFEEIEWNCKSDYLKVSYKFQEENSSLEYEKQKLMKQVVPEKNI